MWRRKKTSKIAPLVKDELAAVETYRQALESVGELPGSEELRRIGNDHERAVTLLQSKIAERGVEPPTTSGAWDAWSQAVEGAARLSADRTTIRALRDEEERGIRSYEKALADAEVDAEIKTLITCELLPRTRSHVSMLERFLNG